MGMPALASSADAPHYQGQSIASRPLHGLDVGSTGAGQQQQQKEMLKDSLGFRFSAAKNTRNSFA